MELTSTSNSLSKPLIDENFDGRQRKFTGAYERTPSETVGNESSKNIYMKATVQKEGKGASVPSSIFNLSVTILGSGVLAMPFACKKCGIVLYLVLLAMVACAADFGLCLLINAMEAVSDLQSLKYKSVAFCFLGERGKKITDWAVIIQQLGATVAYINIIGALLGPVLRLAASNADSFVCNADAAKLYQCLLGVFVIFPLTLLRNIDSLKYTSLAALFFMNLFVLAIVVNGLRVAADPDLRFTLLNDTAVEKCAGDSTEKTDAAGLTASLNIAPAGPQIFVAIPIMCFAFLCHMNAFPIYEELADRSFRNMAGVIPRAVCFCFTVYAVAGVFGYLIFLDSTSSKLFVNFFTHGGTSLFTIIDILRIGVTFSVVFAFPIIVWEARHGLEQQIFGHQPFHFWRNFGLNATILAFALILGCIIPASGLNIPLGLIGSTASPLIVFILPALCHRELVKMEREGSGQVFGPNAISHVNQYAGKTYEVLAEVTLWSGVVLIPVCLGVWAWQLAV